jgi:hypothetical protein
MSDMTERRVDSETEEQVRAAIESALAGKVFGPESREDVERALRGIVGDVPCRVEVTPSDKVPANSAGARDVTLHVKVWAGRDDDG